MYKRNRFPEILICTLLCLFPLPLLDGIRVFSSLFHFPVFPAVLFSFLILFSLGKMRRLLSLTILASLVTGSVYLSGIFVKPYPLFLTPTEEEISAIAESLIKIISTVERSSYTHDQILSEAGKIMNASPPKMARSNRIMNLLGISGVFVPFTQEAILNPDESGFLLPFTAVHELCHAKGLSDEGQANTHAFVKCMMSGNDAFIYSSSVYALKYVSLFSDRAKESALRNLPEDALSDFLSLSVSLPEKRVFFSNYGDLVFALANFHKTGVFHHITSHGVT